MTRSATLIIAGLFLAANVAYAEPPEELGQSSPNVAAIGFDVVILRPLGLAALIASAAAFVPVALMSSPGGRDSVKIARELFITTPWNAVFRQKLGNF